MYDVTAGNVFAKTILKLIMLSKVSQMKCSSKNRIRVSPRPQFFWKQRSAAPRIHKIAADLRESAGRSTVRTSAQLSPWTALKTRVNVSRVHVDKNEHPSASINKPLTKSFGDNSSLI